MPVPVFLTTRSNATVDPVTPWAGLFANVSCGTQGPVAACEEGRGRDAKSAKKTDSIENVTCQRERERKGGCIVSDGG